MYMFIYSVKWYADYDSSTKSCPLMNEKGIVCATSYSEAVANLSKNYGEEDITSVEIKCISEDGENILTLSDEIYNKLNSQA